MKGDGLAHPADNNYYNYSSFIRPAEFYTIPALIQKHQWLIPCMQWILWI